ncbi:hypothetical protein PLCT1_00157 [Planctomycetaceae bacterium]|nr:hypothetical protein PLCT1_00157 [Planctomycetaceae bacterium]
MRLVKAVPFIALFFFIAAFFGPAKRALELKDVSGGSASGEVLIEPLQSRMPRLRTVGIIVYGLKPASVYSVWYADGKGQRTAAGVDTNHFKTDASGKGRYVTSVYEDVLDDWRYIEVMLHADGDPKNTAGMTGALRGDLVYGTHS